GRRGRGGEAADEGTRRRRRARSDRRQELRRELPAACAARTPRDVRRVEHRGRRTPQPLAGGYDTHTDAEVQAAVADESQPRRVRAEPRSSLGRTQAARRCDDVSRRRGRGRTAAPGRRTDVSTGAGRRRAPIHAIAVEYRKGDSDTMKK